MAKDGDEKRGRRAVRSLKDVQKVVEMHESKQRYQVRVVALHGIDESRGMQRLLLDQIRTNAWVVAGIEHLESAVAIDGLIRRSALLLDRVIHDVLLIDERGQPLPLGDVDRLPRVQDPVRFESEDFDYEELSARPRLLRAFQDGKRPHEVDHGCPPVRVDSDHAHEQQAPPGEGHRGASMRTGSSRDAIQHEQPTLGNGHRGASMRTGSSRDAIQQEQPTLGNGHRGAGVRIGSSRDDFSYEYNAAMARPRLPRAIRRSRSEGCLSAPSRSQGRIGGPSLPAPLTVRRHDEAPPRFVGPIPLPRANRAGEEAYPLFVAADVEHEGRFRGQVLILEHPHPRPMGPYAVDTVSLSERMLRAGTGTGEQPLLRAPAIVGLAAMVVAGESPPRHLDTEPALRALVTQLVESRQNLRRHQVGSDAVQSLVAELGGRIELVGTDILTASRPLPELVSLLLEVMDNLQLLWKVRIPADQFKLM